VNAEAFASLYDRHYPRVFRYLLGRLRNGQAAEELSAEVFAIALASFQRGTEPRQVGSWLVGIADHLASRHWRQTRRVEDVPVALSGVGEETDPEELTIGRLESGRLWDCMGALSPEHRQVLLLRIVAGLSAREVGGIMNRREDAVRSVQLRALAALRRVWKEAEVGDRLQRSAD
jgi:RNA polymerase sigma-70 factor (ECF subfamily)